MSPLQTIEHFLEKRKQYGIKPGLERMRKLLSALGNPEQDLRVIHLAGTNGKGSTATFMQDVLVRAQYDVGFFSSPSFTGLPGHFVINQTEISEADLFCLFQQIKPIVLTLDAKEAYPTEFEIITAMAFLYFKERTDIVIVEAGMGGREDTTNVVHPLLSVITSIALDHTQFLGHTIEEIAWHKAGIIKEGRPAIIGPVDHKAMTVIAKEGEVKNAPLFAFGKDFAIQTIKQRDYFTNSIEEIALQLPFSGTYQKENIATSLEALFMLRQFGYHSSNKDMQQAMATFTVPGRFEKMSDEPTIILDSAHNLAGIQALKKSLQTYYPKQTIHCLFAAFKDKAGKEMIAHLQDERIELTLTTFSHERAASIADYAELSNEVETISNWREYMKNITPNHSIDDIFVITGSMHFIMQVRDWIIANR